MIVKAVRHYPDGTVQTAVLSGEPGSFSLEVERTGLATRTRALQGNSLAEALAEVPDIVNVNAVDCLEIECCDESTRDILCARLVDVEPDAALDEDIWAAHPEVAEPFLWYDDDIDPSIEDLVTLRWLKVDNVPHALLQVQDRHIAVPIVDGVVVPAVPLIMASWYSESEVTSFEGSNTAGLLATDILLTAATGDLSGAEAVVADPVDLPELLASWLDDNLLAPMFLLSAIGTPGLSADDATSLLATEGRSRVQVIRSELDSATQVRVTEALAARPHYRQFQEALLEPASEYGQDLYGRFRSVITNEADLWDVLEAIGQDQLNGSA